MAEILQLALKAKPRLHTTDGLPPARIVSQTKNQTTWLVHVRMPSKVVKQYRATTYPESDLIFLQTGARGRTIAAGTASVLLPTVRDAIARAQDALSHPQQEATQ